MMAIKRPIIRDDGVRYPSITDAARALAAEQGCGKPEHMAQSIGGCARYRCGESTRRIHTAYGHTWRFETGGHEWQE